MSFGYQERLPALQRNPGRPEDVLKVDVNENGEGGDDAAEALRHLVTMPIPVGAAVGLRLKAKLGEKGFRVRGGESLSNATRVRPGLSPGGTRELSPRFQPWVPWVPTPMSPEGTAEAPHSHR